MTAVVEEFAYVVFDADDLDAWSRFGRDLLGFEAARDGAALRLRMDSKPFRYLIWETGKTTLPLLGWQVRNAAALDEVAARIGRIGIAASPLSPAEIDMREVRGAIRFCCPNGIVHEVVHGFDPGSTDGLSSDAARFVTGPGGMGHSVWSVPDLEAMDRLMIDGFGMSLREDIPTPAGKGHFYGCNARHHSLAAFSAPALKIEHLMTELPDTDDVGLALDRAIDGGYVILQPLGRHRTDHMFSFYVETPSGFSMEVGCGAILCGDDWEEVRESRRCRPWGHGAAMTRHRQRLASSQEAG